MKMKISANTQELQSKTTAVSTVPIKCKKKIVKVVFTLKHITYKSHSHNLNISKSNFLFCHLMFRELLESLVCWKHWYSSYVL